MKDIDIHVTDNSGQVLSELDKKIQIVLEQWGIAGEGFAKDEINKKVYNTPIAATYVRTGRLKGSITYSTKRKHSSVESPAKSTDGITDAPDGDTVVIGSNVEYAAFVEMGTSRGMKPRPYIKPAVENYTDQYKKIAKDTLT